MTTEEIEAVFAALVALGLFFSLFFAPILIKFTLPAILLFFPKATLVKLTLSFTSYSLLPM